MQLALAFFAFLAVWGVIKIAADFCIFALNEGKSPTFRAPKSRRRAAR